MLALAMSGPCRPGRPGLLHIDASNLYAVVGYAMTSHLVQS